MKKWIFNKFELANLRTIIVIVSFMISRFNVVKEVQQQLTYQWPLGVALCQNYAGWCVKKVSMKDERGVWQVFASKELPVFPLQSVLARQENQTSWREGHWGARIWQSLIKSNTTRKAELISPPLQLLPPPPVPAQGKGDGATPICWAKILMVLYLLFFCNYAHLLSSCCLLPLSQRLPSPSPPPPWWPTQTAEVKSPSSSQIPYLLYHSFFLLSLKTNLHRPVTIC